MAWNHIPPEMNSGLGSAQSQSEIADEPEPSLPRTVTIIDLDDDDGHVIKIPTTVTRRTPGEGSTAG